VVAVEARLLAVREEQQRLTRTVLDLRARIERLRAEGAEEADSARGESADGDAPSHAAAQAGSSANEAADNSDGTSDGTGGDSTPQVTRGPTWV